MKSKKVTVQKSVEINMYEAFDGQLFDTYNECLDYESDADEHYVELAEEIPQSKTWNACDVFPFFGCDDSIRAVKIRNMDDVNIINSLRKIREPYGKKELLTAKHIGTVQVFSFNDEFIEWHGTPEEMIADYIRLIDRLFKIKE